MEVFTIVFKNEIVRFIFEEKIYVYVSNRQFQFDSQSIGNIQNHFTFYNDYVLIYLRMSHTHDSLLHERHELGGKSPTIYLYALEEELEQLDLKIREWKKKN